MEMQKRDNTDTERRPKTASLIPVELLPEIDAYRARAENTVAANISDLGLLAIKVMGNHDDSHGKKVILELSRRLGEKKPHIYRAMKVMSAFTPTEVHDLMGTGSAGQQPLYFNHLVQLARIESPEDRQALIDKSRTERTSVKDLSAEVDLFLGEAKEEGGAAEAEASQAGEEDVKALEQEVRSSLVAAFNALEARRRLPADESSGFEIVVRAQVAALQALLDEDVAAEQDVVAGNEELVQRWTNDVAANDDVVEQVAS